MANSPYYKPGRYVCRVLNQALGESSTGKPQFVLRFTVMGLVDPADPAHFIPDPAQYERTHYRSITEATIKYFCDDLRVLGFHGDSFKALGPETEGFHNFAGRQVDMWCSHKPDLNGELREEWGVARAGGSPEVKPLEKKKVRELDNLFGKHLKALRAANGAAKPLAAQPAPANELGITEDDVPF